MNKLYSDTHYRRILGTYVLVISMECDISTLWNNEIDDGKEDAKITSNYEGICNEKQ